MTDYKKLVEALRTTERICRDRMDGQVMLDAAAAIEALQAEIRESMQKCAECGDEQEQKIKELQARLGEAENSAERWKDMYLTKHEPKRGEWNNHEVACLLAEMFGDDCACNLNGIDEWLPQYCEFAETCCPNPGGVACWEQFLKHRSKMEVRE